MAIVPVRSVDSEIDSLFWQRPSDADSNCQKMGQSQRRNEEGGFEGGGVGYFSFIAPTDKVPVPRQWIKQCC